MLVILSAFWLGIIVSISPCPLATNIAAITYLSKHFANRWIVAVNSLFYALGRAIIYVLLGLLFVNALLSIPAVSIFLQNYLNKILGILLILTGMYLLGLVNFSASVAKPSDKVSKNLLNSGILGSLLLGALFALAFCPVSAALFFGSLIPLATAEQSPILVPLSFGIGTSLPVIIFTVIITFSVSLISKAFKVLNVIEKYARIVTGLVFIGVGIYYSLTYIFEVI